MRNSELSAFVAALTFLTRLPLPAHEHNAQTMQKSIIYFPLVGLVVALFGTSIFLLADWVFSLPLAVVLGMISTVLVTGAFHEDGLADTADGLGGGWTVEQKLQIMKDSRLGTYGAVALIAALALKFSALVAIDVQSIPAALICAHVLGRWSVLPLLRYCPYVGGEKGTGAVFLHAVDDRSLLVGTLIASLLVLILAPANGFLLLLGAMALVALCRLHFLQQLGGVTGDTLGAANQVVELGVYLLVAAHFSH